MKRLGSLDKLLDMLPSNLLGGLKMTPEQTSGEVSTGIAPPRQNAGENDPRRPVLKQSQTPDREEASRPDDPERGEPGACGNRRHVADVE